ncbi:MAG: RagB/SusD family nutrient uptake outer membrane protein [Ginsengibacter sp.]
MKTKYILICLAGLIFFNTSCKKFLDQNPNSQATDQTTWKSDGDANASVAACYSLIRSAFNAAITYYTYGDLISDEFSDIVGGDGAYSDIRNMNWGIAIPYANTYDPRLKLRLYTNFYTAIAQSNRCLHFINLMPASAFNGSSADEQQASKNRYLGEAYFTRAFNYFYIARVWGDVPLVTEYSNDASSAPQLPRVPQKQVLAQAILDLQMSEKFLNWENPGSSDRVVRADKGSAFALMAHVYAWQGEYDSCNMACDSVINSGSYSLVSGNSYMDIYKGQSSEGIFEISQSSLSESMAANNVYAITGVTLTPPYLANGAVAPAWQINTGTTSALYTDTNDIRFKKAFVILTSGSSNPVECIKYATIQNLNNNPAYQVATNNIIIFRLAGIMLLKAEALAAKAAPDDEGALSLVNAVRARAGISPLSALSGNDLLQAISDERGRELFLEGHRFFDLIRLERLTHEQQLPNISQPEFDAGMYYWPVDPTLFITNKNLTQTPFWQSRMR